MVLNDDPDSISLSIGDALVIVEVRVLDSENHLRFN